MLNRSHDRLVDAFLREIVAFSFSNSDLPDRSGLAAGCMEAGLPGYYRGAEAAGLMIEGRHRVFGEVVACKEDNKGAVSPVAAADA